MQKMQSSTSVLEIDKLKVNFYTYEGVVKAIDEISVALENGETLGIVGGNGMWQKRYRTLNSQFDSPPRAD